MRRSVAISEYDATTCNGDGNGGRTYVASVLSAATWGESREHAEQAESRNSSCIHGLYMPIRAEPLPQPTVAHVIFSSAPLCLPKVPQASLLDGDFLDVGPNLKGGVRLLSHFLQSRARLQLCEGHFAGVAIDLEHRQIRDHKGHALRPWQMLANVQRRAEGVEVLREV